LNTRCSAIKRDGTRCNLQATGQQGTCWAHDERNAAQRRRIAAKGGRGRANSVIKELHAKLEELTERVEAGTLVPYRGAVCAQLINTRIRLIEIEKKVEEQQVDAERLERLERLERRARTGGPWGA
jgi:hypothetical protein